MRAGPTGQCCGHGVQIVRRACRVALIENQVVRGGFVDNVASPLSGRCRVYRGDFAVTRHEKFLNRLLQGHSDANLRFDELLQLLGRLGFESRVRGSHHIFTKLGVVEILNLQPKGELAKPYQVKQVRNLITAYGLLPNNEEQEEQGEER